MASMERRTNRLAIGIAITVSIVIAILAALGIVGWVVLSSVSEPQISTEEAAFINLPFSDGDREPAHIAQVIGQEAYNELINADVLRYADSEYWKSDPCMQIEIRNISTESEVRTLSWVYAIAEGEIVKIDKINKIITIQNGGDEYSFYATEETQFSFSIEYIKNRAEHNLTPEDITVETTEISFEDLKVGDRLDTVVLRITDKARAVSTQTIIRKDVQ